MDKTLNENTTADELDRYLPFSDWVYHTSLQATHDDDSLDQAAAAFAAICVNSSARDLIYASQPVSGSRYLLTSLEMKSLIHLLSPEASYRCNLTAAECVSMLHHERR